MEPPWKKELASKEDSAVKESLICRLWELGHILDCSVFWLLHVVLLYPLLGEQQLRGRNVYFVLQL